MTETMRLRSCAVNRLQFCVTIGGLGIRRRTAKATLGMSETRMAEIRGQSPRAEQRRQLHQGRVLNLRERCKLLQRGSGSPDRKPFCAH